LEPSYSRCNIAVRDSYIFKLSSKLNLLLTSKVLLGEIEVPDSSFVQKLNGIHHINCLFRKKGSYKVSVYVKGVAETGSYHGCVDFKVTAEGSSNDTLGFPTVLDSFFNYGLTLIEPQFSRCHLSGIDRLAIKIGSTQKVLMMANVLLNGINQENASFVQTVDGIQVIECVFVRKGDYRIVLFVKGATEKGNYHSCLEFSISSKGSSLQTAGLPKPFTSFVEHGCQLFYPIQKALIKGTIEPFKINAPDALEVAIVNNEQWSHLRRIQNNIWEGNVPITANKVIVYGKFPGTTNFSGLLEYASR